MPLYLVHGFRWPRNQIRILIILSDLLDATADYIQNPTTIAVLRQEIFTQYPHLEKLIPNLTFVEQHDPDDLRTGAQPWAFVADTVITAGITKDKEGEGEDGKEAAVDKLKHDLSINVWEEITERDASGEELSAMVELKRALAAGAGEETTYGGVGWFAVWNGDVERRVESEGEDEGEDEDEETDAKSVKSDDSVVTQTHHASVNGVSAPATATNTTAAPAATVIPHPGGSAGGARNGQRSSKNSMGHDDSNNITDRVRIVTRTGEGRPKKSSSGL